MNAVVSVQPYTKLNVQTVSEFSVQALDTSYPASHAEHGLKTLSESEVAGEEIKLTPTVGAVIS